MAIHTATGEASRVYSISENTIADGCFLRGGAASCYVWLLTDKCGENVDSSTSYTVTTLLHLPCVQYVTLTFATLTVQVLHLWHFIWYVTIKFEDHVTIFCLGCI